MKNDIRKKVPFLKCRKCKFKNKREKVVKLFLKDLTLLNQTIQKIKQKILKNKWKAVQMKQKI